jgi:hypothetical protein
VPPKTIASLLNNESNLRILEKLKLKPYYPRELAAEMKLSEPFLVRRLKAMEEYDIVEGRWENEGGRKVKRYYVKDITMQLGKDGLKVTSFEAPVTGEVDMRKEAARFMLSLPVIIVAIYGFTSGNLTVLALLLSYFVWVTLINIALYREYRLKNHLTAIIMLLIGITASLTTIGIRYVSFNLPDNIGELIAIIYAVIVFVFIMSFIYHVRFSQIEARAMIRDKRELIASLDSASVPVKIFYLPTVIKWRIHEYFGLI